MVELISDTADGVWPMFHVRRLRPGAKLCLAVLLLGACGTGVTSTYGADAPVSDRPVHRAIGEPTVAFTTMQDVVSYADSVAVITVRAEAAEPADAATVPSGAAFLNRRVTMHVVELVAPGGAVLPHQFMTVTAGWTLHHGERNRMALNDYVRLEMGATYLAPVFQLDCQWSVIDAGIVALASVTDQTPPPGPSTGTPLAQQLARAGVAGTRAALPATPPNPVALANQALDPDARFQAVLRSQGLTPPYQATPERDCPPESSS